MKQFNKIVIFIMLLHCTTAFSKDSGKITVYGGQNNCESWNGNDDIDKNLKDIFNSSWLAGYMSGANSGFGENIFHAISIETASDYVSKYCKEHPSGTADSAISELAIKLIKLK